MLLCTLCPRYCNCPRNETEGSGYCHMGTMPVVARAATHTWEEPCLSGNRGSGTVFFSGCALGCVYCQNHTISRDAVGKTMSSAQLAELFERVEALGVHNLNLVTPTHFAPAILDALRIRKPSIPVIWNSSGYETIKMVRECEGLIDIFLPDIKYAIAQTAQELANAPDYFDVALSAVEEMCRLTGAPRYGSDGLLQSGTLVRHLVLPLRIQDSLMVLNAIKERLPQGTPVSLMRQYTPNAHCTASGLNRSLTQREYARVKQHMLQLELPGFWQQKDATNPAYIPTFMDEESTRLFSDTKT